TPRSPRPARRRRRRRRTPPSRDVPFGPPRALEQPVLLDDGEQVVVHPFALELEVAAQRALAAEAELLEHLLRGDVGERRARFEPVKPRAREEVVDEARQR